MRAHLFERFGPTAAVLAALLASCAAPSAFAGGVGRGGMMMRPGGSGPGWHGGMDVVRPPMLAGAARLSPRGLPPVSGVIHERPGMRPYLSSYGHTNTAAGRPGFGGVAAGGYGHTATGLRGFGRARGGPERFRLARAGARFVGGFGGAGFGYAGGYGGYGGVPFDAGGGYGGAASYGDTGPYGGSSTNTQVSSYGGTYRSETPLAATFAEPPLAPSPGSGYDTANRYAFAASDDVPYAARIVSVNRAARRACDCGPRIPSDPVIYRYGVGTAY